MPFSIFIWWLHFISCLPATFYSLSFLLFFRDFLQILEIPVTAELQSPSALASKVPAIHSASTSASETQEMPTKNSPSICYDPEWMAIIRKTHHLLDPSRRRVCMPSQVLPATAEVWSACSAVASVTKWSEMEMKWSEVNWNGNECFMFGVVYKFMFIFISISIFVN